MEKAHKQRLVGGVVLLALALILVPTILDFSQEKPSPLQQAEMPDAPDAMDMETLPLEVWSEPVAPEVGASERVLETPESEAVPEPETAPQGGTEPSQTAAAPAPRSETSGSSAGPEAQSAQVATPKPEKKPEPKSEVQAGNEAGDRVDIPAGATAWVIQVASFSDQPKAFALRDRLRAAGHPTFIERGQSGGSTIYRVKVGPVLQRVEADKLKQQVDRQTKLDSLVMQYK